MVEPIKLLPIMSCVMVESFKLLHIMSCVMVESFKLLLIMYYVMVSPSSLFPLCNYVMVSRHSAPVHYALLKELCNFVTFHALGRVLSSQSFLQVLAIL